MLVILSILFVAVVAGAIMFWLNDESEVTFLLVIAGIIVGVATIPNLANISFGEKTYTGYIYSSENVLNMTVGHIRFSENTGEDKQPSFCTVKGSEQAKKLKELTGSGKKVFVTVPEGFVLNNWFGQCGIPAVIEEAK